MNHNEQNHNEQKHLELKNKLAKIATMLAKSESWHKKSAYECRKIGIRGLGRFHDAKGINYGMDLFEISKIFGDKLHFLPKIEYNEVAKADSYKIEKHADFKRHFSVWHEHSDNFNYLLLETLPHTNIDICLNEKIMKLLKSVQNERFYVETLKNSFEFVGWNAHDIAVKSKWIHDYFEKYWKIGDEIDLNIG